jgi:CheY-like chemotaxis protein
MAIMNGVEFLQAVKKDERLRRVPVVVLMTSDDQ